MVVWLYGLHLYCSEKRDEKVNLQRDLCIDHVY